MTLSHFNTIGSDILLDMQQQTQLSTKLPQMSVNVVVILKSYHVYNYASGDLVV